MSEKYTKPALPTPEEIQKEELRLLDLQTDHAKTMDELGITEKAKQKLTDLEAAELNDLSRPSVALSTKEQGGITTEWISIRFATPELSPSGQNSTSYVYADFADIAGDSVSIEPEFTHDEAEALINMVKDLKQARDSGILPHLSYNLAGVNNPLANITTATPKSH